MAISGMDHLRSKVMTTADHPLAHDISSFSYVNPALPPFSNGSPRTSFKDAMDYLYAVLYPRTKASVANPAALPLLGNSINDFRVVTDDGDGKYAGYVWVQLEGDVSPSWHKIYDPDFGVDDILTQLKEQTQAYYVFKFGHNDIDATGADIAGDYAGKRIWGGSGNGYNLTLSACDGTGGYLQADDHFRPVPAKTGTLDIGTSAEKFRDAYFSNSVLAGTLTIAAGSITDSSGTISFGNENLVTTGSITATTVASAFFTGTTVGNLTLANGSITSASGAISFDNENLSTTGTGTFNSITANTNPSTFFTGTTIGTLTLANSSITDSSGSISFNDENLTTTGNLTGGRLDVDNLRLDGNTLSSTVGGLTITAAASVVATSGAWTIDGLLNVDTLRLDGGTLSTTAGSMTLTPASGNVISSLGFEPSVDNTSDLGGVAKRFDTLYLGTQVHDGTNATSIATLISLREILTGIAVGYTIFWDGAKFVSSAPDTEVDHGTVTGLLDDDHTQYALLAGRATGQTLNGGVAANENLILESTAHATKGVVQFNSTLSPLTNSDGSTGQDLGQTAKNIRDLFMKGYFKGGKFENLGADPGTDATTIGRVIFNTTNNQLSVCGNTGVWKKVGNNSKYYDMVWAAETTKTQDVSAAVSDARLCLVQLLDTASNYVTMDIKVERTSATQVTVTSEVALTGTYRLLVMEVSS